MEALSTVFMIKRFFVLLAKILFLFIVFTFIGLKYIQDSSWFRMLCRHYTIVVLRSALVADVDCEMQRVAILGGQFSVKGVKIIKNNQSLTFAQGVCHISLISLLKHMLLGDTDVKITASFTNGSVRLGNQAVIRDCYADINVMAGLDNSSHSPIIKHGRMNARFDLCYHNNIIEHCFLFGILHDDEGYAKIKTAHNSIAINLHKDANFIKISSVLKPLVIQKLLPPESKMKGTLSVNGLFNLHDTDYKVQAQLNNFFLQTSEGNKVQFDDVRLRATHKDKVHTLVIKDFAAREHIAGFRYKKGKLHGNIKADLLLKKVGGLDGYGHLTCYGSLNDGNFQGTLRSKDLRVLVPRIHNVLNQIELHINGNFYDKTIFIDKILLGWHKGTLVAQDILVHDMIGHQISIPFIVSDFYFQPNKKFYVYLNGDSCFTYDSTVQQGNRCRLSGNLTTDKGRILYGFDTSDQDIVQSSNHFPINLDLMVNAEHIKMSHKFFDLNFASEIKIEGTVCEPIVSGIVTIPEGIFKFPSTNLPVIHARIYVADQEVILDVAAKAKFHKYAITMRILGPLVHPKILFESEPLLSTQQIIALLVTGFHNTALSSFIPNLFMRNFEALIFGNGQGERKNEDSLEYVKRLLNVLKNIRVISVEKGKSSDEGKYRVEVDIADGLRAAINNDFAFEYPKYIGIEYDMSDGIMLKGSKDRNNNVGGEVQLRWKI